MIISTIANTDVNFALIGLIKEKNPNLIVICVATHVEEAIKLYEKYGFKSLGTRKGYYQDNNESALIMWTENIFYDKFKTIYEKNCELLKTQIEIK
jgi:hypothetical protein